MIIEHHRAPFLISTDPAKLDIDAIHDYLCNEAYWSKGRSRETVAKSVRYSLNFGVYEGEKQIGLARVITDYATYAYLTDVYILSAYQGRGLGKWLMQSVIAHPEMADMRRFVLLTRDAHGLYQQVGFHELEKPERWMERLSEAYYQQME